MMIRYLLVVLIGLSSIFTAQADSPVVDLSQPVQVSADQTILSRMSTSERIARLERLMANQTQLTQQIEQLQSSIRQLQGQVETLQHENQQLKQQQRKFYADLDKRLNKQSKKVTSNAPKTLAKLAENKMVSGSKNAQDAYQQAYQLLRDKQYVQADQALASFIKDHPHSELVANAYYWRGELALIDNKSKQARQQFEDVLTKFPNHPKVASAKYKLALINIDQGKVDQAKQQLQALIADYPGTNIARLAKNKLDNLL